MDRTLQEQIVTMVLRTAGVLAILIGLILTTQAIVASMAASSTAPNLPRGMSMNVKSAFGNLTRWAIVGQFVIVIWGAIMFAAAKSIAEWIAARA